MESDSPSNSWLPIILLLLGLILISGIRLRLVDMPLERDEGEYAYAASRLLAGSAPYEDAYNMKLPGTYYTYAAGMALFGKTKAGVHLLLLVINLLSMALIWAIGRKWFKGLAPVIGALVFGLLTLDDRVLGFAGHATHFVTFYALAGIWLWLLKARPWSLILGGFIFGLAFLAKQPGIFFLPAGMIILYLELKKDKKLNAKNILFAISGFLLPLLFTVLHISIGGSTESAWFWVIKYGLIYASGLGPGAGWENFSNNFGFIFSGLWWLYLFGFLGIVISGIQKVPERRWSIILIFFAGLLATLPGFYFRPHYFIVLIPGIAFGVTALLGGLNEKLSENEENQKIAKWLVAGIGGMLILPFFIIRFDYCFSNPTAELSKEFYGINPFVESEKVADFLKRNSAPESKIAVLGSEPQILFLADRQGAAGNLYMYPLVGDHSLAKEMRNRFYEEVRQSDPEYLVYIGNQFSWLGNAQTSREVSGWMSKYLQENQFKLVGIVDQFQDNTNYRFQGDLSQARPEAQNYILIFGRNK